MASSALKCWTTITTISFLNVFCYSKRKPLPRHPHPAYPSPWQPLHSFQFLWICLVCILHINGIVSYVTLCAWLLSLGIIFFPAVPHSVWDFRDWAQHRALATGLPGKSLPWHNVFQVCTCFTMNQFLIFKWPNNIPLKIFFKKFWNILIKISYQTKDWRAVFEKGQMINIFSFQGHRQCLLQGSSLLLLQEDNCDDIEAKGGPRANKTLFTEQSAALTWPVGCSLAALPWSLSCQTSLSCIWGEEVAVEVLSSVWPNTDYFFLKMG